MIRGTIVAAMLGLAGVGLMALGLGSTPASADPYCGPGYHWYAGHCYPNRPVVYAPAAPVYYPAPVVLAPTFGIGFGFGGGFHHGFHR
jgi:hypothetical protein